jgi:hypothetical protein
MDLQPERARRFLHILYLCFRSWIGGIYKQTDGRGFGYQIAQQPQSFCNQLGTQLGHTGNVTAGPIQAGHETEPDRIAGRIKNNRDSRL